ncbi:long-chain-fatty-acid--CoA ligase FadD15 [Abditibacteriota bacterium]|nr:long-chain-fatty-acid--CoA ligase FadD15 [Abditibacteriota bacterium]
MFDPSKPPSTLAELAQRSFVTFPDRPYLGQKKDAKYDFKTFAQIAVRVQNLCGALLESGLVRGERVAILGDNRPEWAICDLACQMSGIISVPIYATLPSNQVETILRDCGAQLVVVSDKSQLAKIEEIRANLPDLRDAWTYADFPDREVKGAEFWTKNPTLYESTWPAALPTDVATIIYTSGTTGEPKGVMLQHKNIIADIEGILKIGPHLGPDDVFMSFLPLAHTYERTAGHFLPLRLGASIGYCESLRTVNKNFAEVRPTVMACVPRLLESSRESLESYGNSLPEKKRGQFAAALKLAQKAGMAKGGFPGAPSLNIIEKIKFAIFERAVYTKVRDRFGGRMKHFISGGAPMSPEMGGLFLGVGLEVLEGYGLTETSPVIAVNLPFGPRFGTVGPPLPGVEVKIAEDGEILARGATIMKGYWNKTEATSEVLDAENWFHTGDIGEFNKNGCLRITDRKKDLLVLGNGKKVAPQPIELRLQESRYIAQVVLLGDKAKAVSALIVPNFGALREWATSENLGVSKDEELAHHAATQKLLRREIDQQTTGLADFEKIRKFVVLSEPFSAQNGEMTPTLKIKRRVVAEKYGALVE